MEQILSKDNKNIKEYGRLASSRSFREKSGLFAIESVKLVEEAADSGVRIRKAFVTEQCIKKHPAALQKLLGCGAEVYQISDAVEEKLTRTQNAGGLFAICGRLDNQKLADKIITSGKYLYLAQLQDSGNVGTILRTAEAMGLDGVIVSAGTCDIYSLKVLRASMGAAFRLPVLLGGDPAVDLEQLGQRFATFAAVVDPMAQDILKTRFPQNSVIAVGNEGNGLSPAAAAACGTRVTIRMKGCAESLNAGMAAGILIWELMKDS